MDKGIEGKRWDYVHNKLYCKSVLYMGKGIEGREWDYIHKKLCCDLCYLWVKVLKEEDETMYTMHSALFSVIYG